MNIIKEYDKKESLCLNGSNKVFDEMKDLRNHHQEIFVVFYMDSKLKTIAREIKHIGTSSKAIISPGNIFKSAIMRDSENIIISHNHPSDDSYPSDADRQVTRQLIEAGNLLDIKVLDHVIVTNTEYYSFNERGQL